MAIMPAHFMGSINGTVKSRCCNMITISCNTIIVTRNTTIVTFYTITGICTNQICGLQLGLGQDAATPYPFLATP
jgi:hypothetical protein